MSGSCAAEETEAGRGSAPSQCPIPQHALLSWWAFLLCKRHLAAPESLGCQGGYVTEARKKAEQVKAQGQSSGNGGCHHYHHNHNHYSMIPALGFSLSTCSPVCQALCQVLRGGGVGCTPAPKELTV